MILFLLILSLCISGCSGQNYIWVKQGATEQNFKTDAYECKRDALCLPSSPKPWRPSTYANTPGGALTNFGDTLQDISRDIQEQTAIQKLYDECMESKGWHKKSLDN